MAGAEGFEPPLAVLETAGLAVKPMPLRRLALFDNLLQPNKKRYLFGFAMRLVLAAIRAKLLQFEALRRGPLIFRFAVVAVLAFAALKLNNLSRHGLLARSSLLFQNLRHRPGSNSSSAFADRKAQALVHGHRRDQLHFNRHVVPRHHHLHAFGQLRHPLR